MVAILDEWSERPDEPADKILDDLGPRLDGIPDAEVFAFNPPSIRGLGQSGGYEYQLQDRSDLGLGTLQIVADDFIAAAGEDRRLGRTFSSYRSTVPQMFVDIDRTQMLKLGRLQRRKPAALGNPKEGLWWHRHPACVRVVAQASCLCSCGGTGILPVFAWWHRHPACVRRRR